MNASRCIDEAFVAGGFLLGHGQVTVRLLAYLRVLSSLPSGGPTGGQIGQRLIIGLSERSSLSPLRLSWNLNLIGRTVVCREEKEK